jgi:hypothetical protein
MLDGSGSAFSLLVSRTDLVLATVANDPEAGQVFDEFQASNKCTRFAASGFLNAG